MAVAEHALNLDQLRTFEAVARRLPGVATATAASYFLPPVIREFKRRHPGVAVPLLVLNSDEALARRRALPADLGVMACSAPTRRRGGGR